MICGSALAKRFHLWRPVDQIAALVRRSPRAAGHRRRMQRIPMFHGRQKYQI